MWWRDALQLPHPGLGRGEASKARHPARKAEGGSPSPELTLHLHTQRRRGCVLNFHTLAPSFPPPSPSPARANALRVGAGEQLGSQKAGQGRLCTILRKMCQDPSRENETGTRGRERENPGRGRAWESSVRMCPTDQLAHLHTHLTEVPWPLRQDSKPGTRAGGRCRGRV